MVLLSNVNKFYANRKKPALENINLHIKPGQFVYLSGPSGAGKTTFLRLLFGAEIPSEGQLTVLGQDMGRITAKALIKLRRRIGVVFQDFKLIKGMTVQENVTLALSVCGLTGKPVSEQVRKVLAQVGLKAKASVLVENLSGGEQQRVAIARALVVKPRLLLADEPTGNLDPENAREIMRLVVAAHASGTTVVIATHDPGLIKLVRGPKVVRIFQGRLEKLT